MSIAGHVKKPAVIHFQKQSASIECMLNLSWVFFLLSNEMFKWSMTSIELNFAYFRVSLNTKQFKTVSSPGWNNNFNSIDQINAKTFKNFYSDT